MPSTMTKADVDQLVKLLFDEALADTDGTRDFFQNLLRKTQLPRSWRGQLAHVGEKSPDADARRLVEWAINRGGNHAEEGFQTLGSILRALLEDLGTEKWHYVVALVVGRQLLDRKALESWTLRYQIPRDAAGSWDQPAEFGPKITWAGPNLGSPELQRLKPTPELWDVGFLQRALERTTSVCRVEIPEGTKQGTGVMIDNRLLLTNYHVLAVDNEEGPLCNPADVVLRFGCFSEKGGEESRGQVFRLDASKPILGQSKPGQLDYVLLQVEEAIAGNKDIKPVPIGSSPPAVGAGLHILQHPLGQAMMVSLSNDGVASVSTRDGRIQYVTQTKHGSSGAPCFDKDWKFVALHHAQRNTLFGTIREGILFDAIHAEIATHLGER
jgi:V8-like Glu-specific endopeptidase